MPFRETSITIPASPDHVVLPLDLAENITLMLGFEKGRVDHVRLALEEYLNYILDASAPRGDEQLRISFRALAGSLRTEILSSGRPIDPSTENDVPQQLPLSDAYLSMGAVALRIANSVSDRYFFENRGKEGCMLGFEFDLPDREVARGTSEIADENVPCSTEEVTAIHLARPEDALAVCQRIYDCYGHSYVNDDIYHPERVSRMISDGSIKSVVAATPANTIAGHLALFFPEPGSVACEIGMAVVAPEFRNRGLMSKMHEYAAAVAGESGIRVLFSHAVTEHEFTQRVDSKSGFSSTALLLGYASASIEFRGIDNPSAKRKSTVIEMRFLSVDMEDAALFLPPRHAGLIRDLYQGLGVNITPAAAPGAVFPAKSVFKLEMKPALSISNVFVDRIGKDFEAVIDRLFRQQWHNNVEVVYVYLDLEDPGVEDAAEILERLGFVVAGIFPLFEFEHALVYQFLSKGCVDLQAVHCFSERARRLLEYVTAELARSGWLDEEA